MLFRNARVWSGLGDDLELDTDVLVANGIISEVRRSSSAIPEGVEAVDLDGRFLMPGLIDMHVHLVWSGSADPATAVALDGEQLTTVRAVENAVAQVNAGVTTVRDLGGNWDIPLTLSRAVERGLLDGPNIVATGQTVIMTGGHDRFWGLAADGPNAVVRAVRRQVSLGAGVIKVAATGGVYGRPEGEEIGATELTLEELAAAAEEAHRLGRKVAAHALGSTGIRNAVLAGIDTIEHGNFLDEEIVAQMKRRGTALCPTLQIYRTIAEDASSSIPTYAVEKARRAVVAHVQSFKMAQAAGIPIVAGTDAGACATPHPALIAELQAMRELGMPLIEVLKAATSRAAQVLGASSRLGTIEPGKVADLLILDANPLEAIGNIVTPWGVVRRGLLRSALLRSGDRGHRVGAS